MNFHNEDKSSETLRRYGYYRLSGYTHFFRDRKTGNYQTGTFFEDVIELYNFDETIRSVILSGISEIEVSLRFHIGHTLGMRGTFAHLDPNSLDSKKCNWMVGDNILPSAHEEWVEEYIKHQARSQEDFALHLTNKYGRDFPTWAATEVMGFGVLTGLYSLMKENDQKRISIRYGVTTSNGDGDTGTFSSWLNHLRHIRNVCAHHSRTWNRRFNQKAAVPNNGSVNEVASQLTEQAQRKTYGTLCVMKYLIARINPSSSWPQDVRDILKNINSSRRTELLKGMGFPDNWKSQVIWNKSYTPDLKQQNTMDSIDSLPCLDRNSVLPLLGKTRESDAKRFLKYLVSHNALIEHSAGAMKYYPAFQFNDDTINTDIADINEILLKSIKNMSSPPEKSNRMILAQKWWLEDFRYGFNLSRIDAIRSGFEISHLLHREISP